MILDKNLSDIRFGKENVEVSEENRHDIIYRVILGDRIIWERQEPVKVIKNYGKNTVFTWKINKPNGTFSLGNCTEVTTMTGYIDWGDGGVTEKWRSGNGGYEHYYNGIDEYNIVLKVTKDNKHFFSGAKIGRVEDFSLPDIVNDEKIYNELIAVRMGNIPFDNNRLYIENKGVLEDYISLKKLYFCKTVDNISIPNRFCYNTSITDLTIPENVSSVGARAIVYGGSENNNETIIWVKGDTTIGEQGLGYQVSGNLINNLKICCKPNSPAAIYASNNGLTLKPNATITTASGQIVEGYSLYTNI
jgi:hypothetical protein